jgi:hypothetical protein
VWTYDDWLSKGLGGPEDLPGVGDLLVSLVGIDALLLMSKSTWLVGYKIGRLEKD